MYTNGLYGFHAKKLSYAKNYLALGYENKVDFFSPISEHQK